MVSTFRRCPVAVELGKGVAMTGLPGEYKEFRGESDDSVGPEFGDQLKQYMSALQQLLGLRGAIRR